MRYCYASYQARDAVAHSCETRPPTRAPLSILAWLRLRFEAFWKFTAFRIMSTIPIWPNHFETPPPRSEGLPIFIPPPPVPNRFPPRRDSSESARLSTARARVWESRASFLRSIRVLIRVLWPLRRGGWSHRAPQPPAHTPYISRKTWRRVVGARPSWHPVYIRLSCWAELACP